MPLVVANNAVSTLASGITDVATQLTLASGDGNLKFPALSAGEYHHIVVKKSDNTYEIMKVTARSGDVLDITRAQQGTTAKAFSTGDVVALRLTKADIEEILNGVSNVALQNASPIVWADAGGSADAITASYTPNITSIATNGMLLGVRAASANATTTPTFNPNGVGAKTIKRENNQALRIGDIAGNGHDLLLRRDTDDDCWLLLNPALPRLAEDLPENFVKNLTLSPSVDSNALTMAIKTQAGTDPSVANPVKAGMRHATLSDGTFNVRSITSALSLVISSGSTLGHTDAAAGFIYWYLIDNAGTLELAASAKFFGASGIVSTSAEGGAGAADSATVMYSATARTDVPFICIGRTTDTQATAGTWAAAPTAVQLWPIMGIATQAEAEAGTAQGPEYLMDALRVRQAISAISFSKRYQSGAQTITSAGLLTLAHGLGEVPKLIVCYLECLSNEDGYTDGMLIPIDYQATFGAQAQGVAVVKDATNISIRYGSQAAVFTAKHFTTGASVDLTNTNFALHVEAYA